MRVKRRRCEASASTRGVLDQRTQNTTVLNQRRMCLVGTLILRHIRPDQEVAGQFDELPMPTTVRLTRSFWRPGDGEYREHQRRKYVVLHE